MRLYATFFAFVLTATATSASGWCDNADWSRLNDAERTICSNQNLRGLDTNLATVFYSKRDAANPAERARLITEQRDRWLPYRDVCGPNPECLAVRYATRIAELTGSLSAAMLGGGASIPDYTINANGIFEKQEPDGSAQLFNPLTGMRGFRAPNGQVTWFSQFSVNPLGLPSLPGSYELPSQDLANRVTTLLELVLSEDQRTQLVPHAPDEFFLHLDFLVNAMVYVVRAAQ